MAGYFFAVYFIGFAGSYMSFGEETRNWLVSSFFVVCWTMVFGAIFMVFATLYHFNNDIAKSFIVRPAWDSVSGASIGGGLSGFYMGSLGLISYGTLVRIRSFFERKNETGIAPRSLAREDEND